MYATSRTSTYRVQKQVYRGWMSKNIITDWTYDHLVKQYCDFLVVCLHSICYYRNLYDRTYFTLSRAYNCPVQKCKHPLLSDYINGVVASVAEELRRSSVARIAVVILSAQDVALERFTFDVSSLPIVAQEDLYIPYKAPSNIKSGGVDDLVGFVIRNIKLVNWMVNFVLQS